MSFKGFDRQTFIVDSAKAFGSRRISKREFLRRMGIAGIGFSGFAAGMLGNQRRRGGWLSSAQAADITLPDDQVKFLKEVGGKYKGATVRYTSEATPPTVVLNQIKDQFTNLTGINVEVEIVPLEQVLAKATQDVQGQLGTYDLYYLDQSWVATFAQDCIDPVQYTKDKPDLAMPGFDWDDSPSMTARWSAFPSTSRSSS
jgi:multiple sugar transport system substrate-binding protein